MHDHGVGSALISQNVQHIAVGFAVVDHQRLADALREPDVPAEGFVLNLGRRAVVGPGGPIVIETGLADGHHPRMLRHLLQLARGGVVEVARVHRVQRDRRVDPVVPVRRRNRPPRVDHVVGNCDNHLNADTLGMVDDRPNGLGRTTTARGEMRVRVDEPVERRRVRRRLAASTLLRGLGALCRRWFRRLRTGRALCTLRHGLDSRR